jgi:hypothetical protein
MLQSFTVAPDRAPRTVAPCTADADVHNHARPCGTTTPARAAGRQVAAPRRVRCTGSAAERRQSSRQLRFQAPPRLHRCDAIALLLSLQRYKHKRYRKSRSWMKSPSRLVFRIENEMNSAFSRRGAVPRPVAHSAGSGTTSTGIRELLMTRLDTLPRKVWATPLRCVPMTIRSTPRLLDWRRISSTGCASHTLIALM